MLLGAARRPGHDPSEPSRHWTPRVPSAVPPRRAGVSGASAAAVKHEPSGDRALRHGCARCATDAAAEGAGKPSGNRNILRRSSGSYSILAEQTRIISSELARVGPSDRRLVLESWDERLRIGSLVCAAVGELSGEGSEATAELDSAPERTWPGPISGRWKYCRRAECVPRHPPHAPGIPSFENFLGCGISRLRFPLVGRMAEIWRSSGSSSAMRMSRQRRFPPRSPGRISCERRMPPPRPSRSRYGSEKCLPDGRNNCH